MEMLGDFLSRQWGEISWRQEMMCWRTLPMDCMQPSPYGSPEPALSPAEIWGQSCCQFPLPQPSLTLSKLAFVSAEGMPLVYLEESIHNTQVESLNKGVLPLHKSRNPAFRTQNIGILQDSYRYLIRRQNF